MISRRIGTSVFPAACTLVAAMNPCPCGNFGHPGKTCRCPGAAVARYRARVSGPLLDRLDALIEVPPLTLTALDDRSALEPSAVVRTRVTAAREFRQAREQRLSEARAGAEPGAGPAGGRGFPIAPRGTLLLRQALVREALSGRAYVRVVCLARTIADLDQAEEVAAEHVAEALAMRLDHRRLAFA